MRSPIVLVTTCLVAAFAACSDDDGSDVLPNAPPGSGAGSGGAPSAGSSGSAGGGAGGSAGRGGSSGGGAGGVVGCTPVAPDAGSDAGLADAGPLDAGADAGDLDASAGNGLVSFAEDLHPIFEEACNPCHVNLNIAGHNVGGELEQAYADAVRLGQELVDRINGGGMPPDCSGQPGDEGCLTVAQVALVQAWVDQCFPR